MTQTVIELMDEFFEQQRRALAPVIAETLNRRQRACLMWVTLPGFKEQPPGVGWKTVSGLIANPWPLLVEADVYRTNEFPYRLTNLGWLVIDHLL